MKKAIAAALTTLALTGATFAVTSVVTASEAQACYRGFILDRRCHEM